MKCITEFVEGESDYDELLSLLYGMKQVDKDIFVYLFRTEESLNIDEISDQIGRERSTIYRSVERLADTHCVEIEKENLESGGYRKLYSTAEPEKVRKQMKEDVEKLQQTAREEIESFVEDYSGPDTSS